MFIFVSFFTLHSYGQVNLGASKSNSGKQILSNPYIRDTTYSKPNFKLDTTSWRSKNYICPAGTRSNIPYEYRPENQSLEPKWFEKRHSSKRKPKRKQL